MGTGSVVAVVLGQIDAYDGAVFDGQGGTAEQQRPHDGGKQGQRTAGHGLLPSDGAYAHGFDGVAQVAAGIPGSAGGLGFAPLIFG